MGGLLAGTARPATHAAPTIVIGTKNFPEEYILGELYKQALEAKGFNVSYKENIGSTEIDPDRPHEREDQLLPRVHGRDRPGRLPQDELAEDGGGDLQARQVARGGQGLHRSCTATPFYDTDVLAVTNATAKKYGLKTISDL